MSFWNSEKLIQRQRRRKLIEPFKESFVKHGAYELSLGSEVFLTSEPTGAKKTLNPDEQLVIPPGQFGLLLTGEEVAIPDDAIAFISIRFGIKQRGLINVSGFHVDPGFSGVLKFAVYNAGSQNIVLSQGERVFIIWFSDLSDATLDGYDGEHAKQRNITSEDVMQLHGEVASPAALKKQIDDLKSEYDRRLSVFEEKISTWKQITIAVLTGLIALFLLVLRSFFEGGATQRSVPTESPTRSVQETNRNLPTPTETNGNSATPKSNNQAPTRK